MGLQAVETVLFLLISKINNEESTFIRLKKNHYSEKENGDLKWY